MTWVPIKQLDVFEIVSAPLPKSAKYRPPVPVPTPVVVDAPTVVGVIPEPASALARVDPSAGLPAVSTYGVPQPQPALSTYGLPQPQPALSTYGVPQPQPALSTYGVPQPQPALSTYGVPLPVPAPSTYIDRPFVPSPTSHPVLSPSPSTAVVDHARRQQHALVEPSVTTTSTVRHDTYSSSPLAGVAPAVSRPAPQPPNRVAALQTHTMCARHLTDCMSPW